MSKKQHRRKLNNFISKIHSTENLHDNEHLYVIELYENALAEEHAHRLEARRGYRIAIRDLKTRNKMLNNFVSRYLGLSHGDPIDDN